MSQLIAVGALVLFVGRRRRPNRGPVMLVVGTKGHDPSANPVDQLASLDGWVIADGKGTLSVTSAEVEPFDTVTALASLADDSTLKIPARVRLPVRVNPRRESLNEGEEPYEFVAKCESGGSLNVSMRGTTEEEAVERLREILIKQIQPPEGIELVT